MLNKDRIRRLTEKLENSKTPYGREIWNKGPRQPSALNWLSTRIGENPQSLLGNTLHQIDEQIKEEENDHIENLYQEMASQNAQLENQAEKIDKASAYLGIRKNQGVPLFTPWLIPQEVEISKTQTIATLKHLIESNEINWEASLTK